MRKRIPLFIVTLCLSWGSGGVHAAGEAPTALTVREAIRLAVDNNLDLRAELYNPAQFQADINRAKAVYAPSLTAETVYHDAITPSALRAGPDEFSFESWQLNSALSRLFPSGATASLGFNNSYINDDAPTMLADYWRSNLDIAISQPLLKDFGRENTEAGITLARLAKSASLEKLENRLLALAARVRGEYFTLYRLREQLAVRQKSLDLAHTILAETKARVAAGVLPAMETLNAQFGVATREKDLLDAERLVGNQSDALGFLLQLDAPDGIEPTDPPRRDLLTIDTPQAIERAQNNPEIREQKKNLEIVKLQTKVLDNKTLPDLALTASNTLAGMAHRYPRDLEKVGGIDSPAWSIGLSLRYPLGNEAAENDYRRSRLKTAQTALQLKGLAQQTANTVKAAIRAIGTGFKQLEVTEREAAYAEERLQAFRRRHEVGLATTKEVLEVENDLATAQNNRIAAAVSYDAAITNLWALTGELLERERIRIDESMTDALYANTLRP